MDVLDDKTPEELRGMVIDLNDQVGKLADDRNELESEVDLLEGEKEDLETRLENHEHEIRLERERALYLIKKLMRIADHCPVCKGDNEFGHTAGCDLRLEIMKLETKVQLKVLQ